MPAAVLALQVVVGGGFTPLPECCSVAEFSQVSSEKGLLHDDKAGWLRSCWPGIQALSHYSCRILSKLLSLCVCFFTGAKATTTEPAFTGYCEIKKSN